jgi:rubredoxin
MVAPSSGMTPIDSNAPCPECGGVAVLAAIEPDEPGFDKRTFRCSSCGHQVTTTVKVENGEQS